MKTVKISGAKGNKGVSKWSTKDSQESEHLYVTITVVIHLSKFMECTTPRGNPNINYGFSVTGICHCRFISYNRGTSLLRDADNGRDYVCLGGQGRYEKSLYHSLDFAVNLQLL